MAYARLEESQFHYVIQVGKREFPLIIMQDGMSEWDDHTDQRQIRHPRDRYLEISAFAGNGRAIRQLANECIEFTVPVPLPKAIL